jgi:hypothetical protein
VNQPRVPDAYEQCEAIASKMHSASLMFIAIERLASGGMESGETTDSKQLFEVINQLANVTSTIVKEAYDAAGNLSGTLSRADRQ